MNLIVAVDKGWGIGYKNDLLYHISPDLKQFRAKTLNKVIVMGKNTLLSFPNAQPLKKRENIVVSTKLEKGEGYSVVRSLSELFEVLKNYESEDVFVIGGASIYEQLLPYCDKAYITKIDSVKEADAFFPNLDKENFWKVTEESEEQEFEGQKFKFVLYENENVKEF